VQPRERLRDDRADLERIAVTRHDGTPRSASGRPRAGGPATTRVIASMEPVQALRADCAAMAGRADARVTAARV
jgi:hypothetical protein